MTDPLLVLAIAVVAFFAGACLCYALLICNRDGSRSRW
jgi:hypothetical protein